MTGRRDNGVLVDAGGNCLRFNPGRSQRGESGGGCRRECETHSPTLP
jgi:hypothetical protein